MIAKNTWRGCVTAVVLAMGALAANSRAITVYTQSDLTDSGDDAYFVGLVDADLHRPPMVTFSWGSNLPNLQNRTVDIPTSESFDHYAFFGLDSSGGVFVSFSTPGFGNGQSFENLFPGISESDLIADLPTDGPIVTKFATLLATMPSTTTPIGVTCSCSHLSVGVDDGTFLASFSPVPEPASGGGLLCIAGFSALSRRRRGSKAL